jgi:uncharacterized protein (TIGR02996 family)
MNNPENPDLLSAVIADAEDDAPRLVYADWLEDHGDPRRAAFIRVGCALADKSPAEADYVDLVESKLEILAALRRPPFLPTLPEGVEFDDNWDEVRDDSLASYHRGFPYFAKEPYVEGGLEERHARRFRDALPEMIATTTLRGLRCSEGFSRHLGEILSTPAAAHFSALSARNDPAGREQAVRPVDALISSPAAHTLKWLELSSLTEADADALARVKALGRLTRLAVVHWLGCEPAALRRLLAAEWFGRLRRLRVQLSVPLSPENAAVGVAGLAKLPGLHTLELSELTAEGLTALAAAAPFPALGGLSLRAGLRGEGAVALGRAVMPRLSSLGLVGCGLRNDDVIALARSGLFAGLRVLDLESNEIGDKGIAALAASPCAATLRILRLGDNNFGKRGLAALARPGAFPSLTTLDLRSARKRRASSAEVTAFLAGLNLPGLRHLDLRFWPVEDGGAKALAANPTFANLVGLDLSYCRIGAEGAAALFASNHLRRLVKLELSFNSTGKAVEALLDPAVLPNLGTCWLPGDVPDRLKARLQDARDVRFI